MSQDYGKKKNAELEALCKERSLPHTGKKADLVKRLEEYDAKAAPAPAATTAGEDEIDWDDEPAPAPAAPIDTKAPAADTVVEPPNPPAVANQGAAIDPSKTDDLTVVKPADDQAAPPPAKAAEIAKKEATPVDFSAGLEKTTLDEEIARREARAKKFDPAHGLEKLKEDENYKALLRAKKFGATTVPSAIDRLNEALSERRERKRGRDDDHSGGRGGKRQSRGPRNGRGEGGGSRRQSRSRSRQRQNGGRQGESRATGGASWMSEADKAKAEARRLKYSAPAATS